MHHFAHVASTGLETADCGFGNQTALHSIAKKILLAEKFIMLPGLIVTAAARDVNGREHRQSKIIPPYRLQIDSVEEEVVLDGIIPDILIKSGEKELLVEIAVTNLVDERKKNWVKLRDKATIEIDLSRYFSEIGRENVRDHEKLRNLLLNSVDIKSWIYNPKKNTWFKSLLKQVQTEANNVEPYYSSQKTAVEKIEMQPRVKAIKMEGICQTCGEFTKENDWWMFYTATMTCKCKKCS